MISDLRPNQYILKQGNGVYNMCQSMNGSIDVLKFDLDELYLRSNKNGYAVVDEVKVKGDGACSVC